MFGRRAFILSLAGFGMTPALAYAGAARPLRERSIVGDGPEPTVVKGKPTKLDFGDGLQVPLDKDAFATLWEDSGRWITFGLGMGRAESDSNAKADKAASLTMQIMLLTLAYAPERLERVNGGGWRARTGKLHDLVMGEVPLPGRPVRPANGVYTDNRLFSGPNPNSPADIAADAQTYQRFVAATAYVVKKVDLSLDDVRTLGRLADEPSPTTAR
ncbi:hypothetical protein [Caulobacter sp. UNC279MFTsu5.1]|uniref:hypothetical protein n=1 Tax=Caulobacter sp. UNC279MFTsu5.1 TaxID=1502775 RepID=UPI0008E0AF3E|nr:hypothetical protein [Caulobacter sp. UNC279MFTsu5.1]SFK65053.1 hypothetical protein SAMN02799626_04832 [Caulobacter sp. UNC279MFTsu5.1]